MRGALGSLGSLVLRAVWVPMKERRRNMKVPKNSPTVRTTRLRRLSGRTWRFPRPWRPGPRVFSLELVDMVRYGVGYARVVWMIKVFKM